jgi:hypothetical protein
VGKRTSGEFERIRRDDYPTPASAVEPLLPHLKPHTRYIEPCAGHGCLVQHLGAAGHVLVRAYDLPVDARVARYDVPKNALFCSNPPYHGRPGDLHPLIVNVSDQAAFWALLQLDWTSNISSGVLMRERARLVVAIGRIRWFEDSAFSSYENYCWIRFERPAPGAVTLFVGRKG